MSPAPQRSTSVVQLTGDLHKQIAALADLTNTTFEGALETLVKFGLAEQSRREAELRARFIGFQAAPEGAERDAAMDLLGEAIFGK